MKNNEKEWDAKEERRLLSLVEQGLNNTMIAAALGRTRNSIIGKLSRLKARRPKERIMQLMKEASYKSPVKNYGFVYTKPVNRIKEKKANDGVSAYTRTYDQCHNVLGEARDQIRCGKPVAAKGQCLQCLKVNYVPVKASTPHVSVDSPVIVALS